MTDDPDCARLVHAGIAQFHRSARHLRLDPDRSAVGQALLAGIAGLPPGKVGEAVVNSLHHQGVDRLAPGLRLEAAAPDGQVEAVSLSEPKGFLLGVQWHPEWRWGEVSLSRAIFSAFGDALKFGKK